MPQQAKLAHVTCTTGGNASSKIVPGHMYAQNVNNLTHACNAPMENKLLLKNKKPAITVNDTSLSNIANEYSYCDNRQVETEWVGLAKGKATWLCARSTQHQVACVAASSAQSAHP